MKKIQVGGLPPTKVIGVMLGTALFLVGMTTLASAIGWVAAIALASAAGGVIVAIKERYTNPKASDTAFVVACVCLVLFFVSFVYNMF